MADGFSSDRRGQVAGTAPRFTADAMVAAAILVGGLYAGRDVFVPIVLSILLSFVLAGPAHLLQRLGIGRVPAVGIAVTLAFVAILSLAAVLTMQLTSLAGDLPRYQSTIREKLNSVRGAAGGHGPLERAVEMVQNLAGELSGPAPGARSDTPGAAGSAAGTAPAPIPVEIRDRKVGGLAMVVAYVKPLLHPLATAGLVAIFVVFILVQQVDLRNRLIRLAGSHDLQRTTAAMNDAARRLSRYFLMQVLLNSAFGVVVGIGLWCLGIPSPILWGILAGISRFVPYVGALMAAGGPLLLAGAVDPGWTLLAGTAALFVTIELVVGQVVEPLVYGHSTGLTPVAVIVSVTFWTWLWGGVGLLLATPLTVCLVVLGRHVEHLAFLDVMFGDRPPLTAAESFYQRMLAGDPDEASEQAEAFLREHSLVSYYDEVALKGLALAGADAARGALADERLDTVEHAIATLVEDLSDNEDAAPSPATPDVKRADADAGLDDSLRRSDRVAADLDALAADRFLPAWRTGTPVLCVAGRNGLDRAGALMLQQVLARHGIGADVADEADFAARAASGGYRLVCLSFVDATAPIRVRYAVRRMRRALPGTTILVGAWSVEPDDATPLCEAAKSDGCVSRLGAALAFCLRAATGTEAPDGSSGGDCGAPSRPRGEATTGIPGS